MCVHSSHAYECGPGRRMRQGRVTPMKQLVLGLPKRHMRLPFVQECAMKRDEEAATDGVVDVPETGHDIGYSYGKERPAEAERSFDRRYGAAPRATGGEDDHFRVGERLRRQLMQEERARITRLWIRREYQTRGRRILVA